MGTCSECGMVLDEPMEFHPYVFCVIKKAGLNPWQQFKDAAERMGLGPLPDKPPSVR